MADSTNPPRGDCSRSSKTPSGIGPYKLGIEGRQIYIAYRIHLSDITDESEEEIRKNIVDLAFRADAMDNMLVERFGCEFSEYSKADAQ